jgi:3-hydroxybutyrate dehydrogenase
MEATPRHSSGRCIPNGACDASGNVQGRPWRQHHLHGVGPSKEASALKAPYVTAKHGLIGLAKVVAKEGAAPGVRANVICPGFARTPLVDKQIPEHAKELGISEQEVIKNVMLKETIDGEFTTVDDVAETALFFASFGSKALTGQSIVVSHGWFMQ